MKQLFRQVRIVDPLAASEVEPLADVLLEAGQLIAVAPHLEPPAEAQIHPSKGLVLGPGLVDLYSHCGEPGFEHRETLASMSQAALAGGFTRLSLLPTTRPCLDRPSVLSQLQQFAAPVRLNFWGALTQGGEGKHMTELLELSDAGIVGFSDGQPLSDLGLLRRLLEYLKPLGKPVALWPCDRALSHNGTAREGSIALSLGLPGIPVMAEAAALAAILECVREVETPVHLMRLSTARSVELLAAAKGEGLPLTASVSWLHLLLDATALAEYDPNLRLEPPLGNPSDRLALVEAVKTGVVDAVAVDHSPYTYEEKTVPFGVAPPGAAGLELVLPLLWQRFVVSGHWSATQLWRLLSTAPARCLGQRPPAFNLKFLESKETPEYVLFDPQMRWNVTPENLQSRALNTVWLGQEICGKVLYTYVETRPF